MKKQEKYCGHITIIGNTNVGKSTLINQIIGKKISIVSRKKNTTQDNIIGIKTEENYQSIYTDTPGFVFSKKNVQMKFQNDSNKIIKNSNLIMLVIDHISWTKNDEIILNKIKKKMIPIFMIINKIDKLVDKKDLLPFIQFLKKKNSFKEIVPISAKKQKDIFFLNNIIKSYLPKNSHIYAKNCITKNSIFFTLSEIIRKQLILFSGDELPTIIKVEIESFQQIKQKEICIKSIVWVNNKRQRKIIIGHNGDKIKKISIISRYKIEKEYNMKTHLILWVKNKF